MHKNVPNWHIMVRWCETTVKSCKVSFNFCGDLKVCKPNHNIFLPQGKLVILVDGWEIRASEVNKSASGDGIYFITLHAILFLHSCTHPYHWKPTGLWWPLMLSPRWFSRRFSVFWLTNCKVCALCPTFAVASLHSVICSTQIWLGYPNP